MWQRSSFPISRSIRCRSTGAVTLAAVALPGRGDAVITPDSAAASSRGSDAPGCGIDGGDEGCLIVVLIAVVLALVVASAYVIWAAPAILGEVAFEAALAAALARS